MTKVFESADFSWQLLYSICPGFIFSNINSKHQQINFTLNFSLQFFTSQLHHLKNFWVGGKHWHLWQRASSSPPSYCFALETVADRLQAMGHFGLKMDFSAVPVIWFLIFYLRSQKCHTFQILGVILSEFRPENQIQPNKKFIVHQNKLNPSLRKHKI